MRGEESYFYPVLEKEKDTGDMTLEAFEEHHVSKTVVHELSEMPSGDIHWMPKVKVLRELIDHHVQEEENELFPKAKDVLPNEKLQEIGRLIKQTIQGS